MTDSKEGKDMDNTGGNVQPKRGAEIAKAIHGCGSQIVVCITTCAVFSILLAKLGWSYAIIGCVAFGFAVDYLLRLLAAKRTAGGLAVKDCFAPLLVSIFCGIIFMPIEMLAGNLFSVATCIMSGVLLTVGLLCYRSGRIANPYWLVFPTLTFVYEILPIDLPTPIDNLIGLGANSFHFVFALTVGESAKIEGTQQFGWQMLLEEGGKTITYFKKLISCKEME